VSQEKNSLQQTVARQELSLIDVEKMNNEIANLEEHLMAVHAKKELLQQGNDKLDCEISSRLEGVQAEVKNLNGLLTALRLVPASSKFAQGASYQVAFEKNAADILLEFLKVTIKVSSENNLLDCSKPQLDILQLGFVEGICVAEEAILAFQEKLDRAKETAEEKKEKIGGLEAKIQKLSAGAEKEKEVPLLFDYL
jgi:kinetochore protein NDC80